MRRSLIGYRFSRAGRQFILWCEDLSDTTKRVLAVVGAVIGVVAIGLVFGWADHYETAVQTRSAERAVLASGYTIISTEVDGGGYWTIHVQPEVDPTLTPRLCITAVAVDRKWNNRRGNYDYVVQPVDHGVC